MAKRQNGLTLSDMVRGIQYCVNSSAEIAEQHYVKTLEKFFHPDGTPITQKIRLNHDVQLDLSGF